MSHSNNKQRKQSSQVNSQLLSNEELKKNRAVQKALYMKFSGYLLDLSKLVFGGVILTGIIDMELDKVWLFSTGAVVVAIFSAWGFYIYQRGIQIK